MARPKKTDLTQEVTSETKDDAIRVVFEHPVVEAEPVLSDRTREEIEAGRAALLALQTNA